MGAGSAAGEAGPQVLPYLNIPISTGSTHTSENSFLMATKKVPDSNSAVIRACSKFIIRG